MITAYREPDRKLGKKVMQTVIDTLSSGVPTKLAELRKFGRTLKKPAGDILAFFDRPGTSNGPTEAINGRLEYLRGSALGFRNLTNYIARSLSKLAASDHSYTADCEEPIYTPVTLGKFLALPAAGHHRTGRRPPRRSHEA